MNRSKTPCLLFHLLDLSTLLEGGFGFSFSGGNATRSVNKELDVKRPYSVDGFNSIDLQIIGGWLDMFEVYEMPVDEGKLDVNMINQHLGEFCARNARFLPLVSLPMQDKAATVQIMSQK